MNLSVFRFRQGRNKFLRLSPEISELWVYGPVLSFLPQPEPGSCEFPPDCVMLCQGEGLWCQGISSFPTGFNKAISHLLGASQLVSGFLIENWAMCCCWIIVSLAGRRVEASYSVIFLTSFLFALILKTFINLLLHVGSLNSGDSEVKFHYTDCHRCFVLVILIFFFSFFVFRIMIRFFIFKQWPVSSFSFCFMKHWVLEHVSNCYS